ncbi:MAG: hypothetical protein QOH06_5158 [Acidobacteriota bacterium]|jgi:tetratricopeptide (TPR) repeat protein|nr:hypothetical protein [Acidobacteriota bacterium]
MASSAVVEPKNDVEVRQLMNELLGTEDSERLELVQEERFRSLDLAELLIAESERFEEVSPTKAEELAELAEWIVDQPEPGHPVPHAGLILARSYSLQANARRLSGDHLGAEARFERAASALIPGSEERGFYSQRLACLREEQGRLDEAADLLWHAVDVFRGRRAAQAEGTCLCRLGFLALRENDAERASRLFGQARVLLSRELSPECSPTLAARCCLGMALSLAALGRAEGARRLREESRAPGHAADIGPDPRSLLELDWLEGRLAFLLGEHGEAAGRLSSVRLRLFLQRRLLDAALCSLDLARVYVAMDQEPRIRELIDASRRAFPVSFEQVRADLALNDYGAAAREGRDLERAAMESMDLIRRPLAILKKL